MFLENWLSGRKLSRAFKTGEKYQTTVDSLRAEHKYERAFAFHPKNKLWIAGNHKPTIRGTDTGIWRRVRLIPFERKFEETADASFYAHLLRDFGATYTARCATPNMATNQQLVRVPRGSPWKSAEGSRQMAGLNDTSREGSDVGYD